MVANSFPWDRIGLRSEVTRAAFEAAEEKILEDARPLRDSVAALASRR
jgi:hypothetical protein